MILKNLFKRDYKNNWFKNALEDQRKIIYCNILIKKSRWVNNS